MWGAHPVAMEVGGPGGVMPGSVALAAMQVLGARPVKLPVRVTVVPAAPPLRVIELPPGVSEKTKLPLPPSTCLVTTIWPLCSFEKARRDDPAEPGPATTAVHLAKPTGAGSASAA